MPNENNAQPVMDDNTAASAAPVDAAAAAASAAAAATASAVDAAENNNAPVDAPADNSAASNTPDTPDNASAKDNRSADDEALAAKSDSTMEKAADRIKDADSILVTLSRDPSVDEMAAAIGLTLMLDKMGKHATAIYSGKTPNALEFLEPEKTFESNTNSLQDFIIALNKDKADHLRYKIEDDFVKVYITPYKTTIDEKDLQFSHGDINVDLVISLNVRDAEDLDAALSQHGRIMHDASAINVSNDMPGKLGGIEWDNPRASSISEMIVKLIEKLDQEMPEEVATALMTGVVSATERFSNDKTTPETMEVSAKLMESGANQQLIAVNIDKPEPEEKEPEVKTEVNVPTDGSVEGTILDIKRDEEKEAPKEEEVKEEEAKEEAAKDEAASPEQQLDQMMNSGAVAGQPLMDELAASTPEESAPAPEEPAPAPEEPVAAPVVAPEPVVEPTPELTPEPAPEPAPVSVPEPTPELTPEAALKEAIPEVNTEPVLEAPVSMPEAEVPKPAMAPVMDTSQLFGEQQATSDIDRQVVIPSDQNEPEAAVASAKMPENGVYDKDEDRVKFEDGTLEPLPSEAPKDYGEMMEKELADASANPAISAAPAVAVNPEIQPVAEPMVDPNAVQTPEVVAAPTPEAMTAAPMTAPEAMAAPAAPAMEPVAAPAAPAAPEIPAPNLEVPGVAMPTEASLPPVQPVAVQGDESAANGIPAAPEGVQEEPQKEEVNPVIVQPEPIQDPASVPPVQDPGAFKIPGM